MGKVNNSPLKNSGLEEVCAERRIIGIGVLLLFLASNAQLVYATEESYTLESSHPYSNNYDNTWTITKTGATKIRVHFTKIETESSYDYVYVYDGSDAELAKYDGTHTDKWSPWASGNKIKIRLTTDSSVTKWGFKIDKIEYEVAAGDSWDPTDDSASSGTSITPTTSSQQHGPHSLSSSDNYDWFRISMTAGRTYYFSGSWSSYSDTYGELYSDSGGSNRVAYDDDSGGSGQFSFSYTAANTQTYYLRIRSYSVGSASNYYLNYYYTVPQNDAGSGGDAGNSFSAALSLNPGSYSGTITSTDTEDWYKFQVTQGQKIEVSMTPPSGVDFDLKLYDSDGNEKASSTEGSGVTDKVTYTADTSGTLYWRIKIYQYSGTGQYSFSLTLSQNDAGSGGDAPNSFTDALAVNPGSYNGIITSSDIEDWYKFSVTKGQKIVITMTPPSDVDFDLKLYNQDNIEKNSSTLGTGKTDTVTFIADSTGTVYWRFKVYQFTGTGQYSFSLSITTPQNDAGSGGDAPNNFDGALLLSPGSYTGYVDSEDTEDWYRFSVSEGMRIDIIMTPPSNADFDLRLYDANGNLKASSIKGTGQTDNISFTADTTGILYWRMKVNQYSGSGTYSFTLGVKQNDADSGVDAGNDFNSALSVATGSYKGYIDSSDTQDWYKFSVSKGQEITVSMTPPSGADFDLELYDQNNNLKASSTKGSNYTDTITYTADSSGTWYWRFRIYKYSGLGTYSFTLSIKVVDEYPTISVDASPGAESYNDGTYDWYNADALKDMTIDVSASKGADATELRGVYWRLVDSSGNPVPNTQDVHVNTLFPESSYDIFANSDNAGWLSGQGRASKTYDDFRIATHFTTAELAALSDGSRYTLEWRVDENPLPSEGGGSKYQALASYSFKIDRTNPSAQINSPASGSEQTADFTVSITDYDAGSGLEKCEYKVVSSGTTTKDWTTRTCSTQITITVGPSKDCRHEGTNTCTVYVRARDKAGNIGTDSRSFSISTNKPPTASFTVTPTSGDTTTTFTVDASSSTDDKDPVTSLQVRWDWENDGTYDTSYTTTKTASHQYTTAGTYTIKLEVKDTGGLTSTTTRQVVVQQAEVTAASITGISPIEYEGGKDYTVTATVRSDSDVSGNVDVILTATPSEFAVSPSTKRVYLPARQTVNVVFSASTQSHTKDGTLGFKIQTPSGNQLTSYLINVTVVPLWAPSWWTHLVKVFKPGNIIAIIQNFSWNEEHLNFFKSGDVDYQWELRRPDTPNAWDFVRYDPTTGDCTTEYWWTDLPGYPDDVTPRESEERGSIILSCPEQINPINNEELEIKVLDQEKLQPNVNYSVYVELQRNTPGITLDWIVSESEYCGDDWPGCEFVPKYIPIPWPPSIMPNPLYTPPVPPWEKALYEFGVEVGKIKFDYYEMEREEDVES